MRAPLYWTRALSVSSDKGHPQILLIVKIHDILYIDGRLLFELIKYSFSATKVLSILILKKKEINISIFF